MKPTAYKSGHPMARSAALLALALVLTAAAAKEDVEHWNQLMADSMKALKQSRLSESMELCNQALELAGKFGSNDTHPARALTFKAEIYIWEKKNGLAEQTFKEAVASCENAVGPNNPAVIYPLSSLANYYYFVVHQNDRVVPLFERILKIVEATPGRSDRDFIMWSRNLGMIYQQTGQFKKAEPLFQQAVTVAGKTDAEWLPHELLTFADFYRAWGKYRKAEKLANQALAIRENALKSAGDKVDAQLDLAVSLDSLGAIYLDWKKPAKAEAVYRRSLETIQKFMDPDQADLAPRLTGLAEALRAERKYEQADPLYKRALAITEINLGPDNVAVADLLEKRAALLGDMKKTDEAQALLARAHSIRAANLASTN